MSKGKKRNDQLRSATTLSIISGCPFWPSPRHPSLANLARVQVGPLGILGPPRGAWTPAACSANATCQRRSGVQPPQITSQSCLANQAATGAAQGCVVHLSLSRATRPPWHELQEFSGLSMLGAMHHAQRCDGNTNVAVESPNPNAVSRQPPPRRQRDASLLPLCNYFYLTSESALHVLT